MYEMQCCELIDESCCENDTKLQYWSKMQEKIRNIKKNLFKLEELIEENIEFLDGKLLEEHLNNKIRKFKSVRDNEILSICGSKNRI